jgi:probable phosphoglycerate mutase
MILYFIRHAESEANLLNEFSNGLAKHPLTEKGRQQALDLAHKLKGLPIHTCYTSPILRALQTAEILSTELGATCQPVDALREFDVGILEGRSDEIAWQQFWQLLDAWLVRADWQQRIEQGESFLEVQKRFVPFIQGLIQEQGSSDAHLLLVSHGGIYRCMLPLILRNIDFAFARQHSLPNTAVIRTVSTPDGLVCTQWGELSLYD